jgi:hypothetical protein
MRSLPYPGYSWPLTQHAAGFNDAIIRGMLSCALPFEGRSEVGREITSLMLAAEILTENLRDGQADAWRDYQQLLAELGLIYSTRVSPNLRLTQLAKSYVGGDVEYPAMMGMQAFRYQYPNGQKYTLQATQRAALAGTQFQSVLNQIELHMNAGVMIRPAILLLRVLHELHITKDNRPLSLEEIRQFILPSRINSEWPQSVFEVQQARLQGGSIGGEQVDRTRRNLQDWFKFLRENPFFDTDGSGTIGLSKFSINNLDQVKKTIESGEDISSVWIPLNFSIEEQMAWFAWYGRYSDIISHLEGTNNPLKDEVEEDTEFWDDTSSPTTIPVVLTDVDEDALLSRRKFAPEFDTIQMAENIVKGAMKRYAKHVLHDEIVAEFSRKFKRQGARVVADPNTVDLLVFWGEKCALFEIKTVNYKNLQSRLRLALGQVEEYSFRLFKEHGLSPDRCVILNRAIDKRSWQAEFFAEHMKVGIISRTSSGTSLISPKGCNTCDRWI